MDTPQKNYLGLYLVLTVVCSFLFGYLYDVRGVDFGFWRRLFASILATPTGFIGALLGDLIRRVAMPSAILTSGIESALNARLFWFCGPQLIGMGIGIFLVAHLILR